MAVLRHLQAITDTGSILNLSWTADGTQLAGAGANGNICFAQLVGLTAEVGPIRATLTDTNCVKVYHLLDETTDELDFRDRVIKICLGGDHIFHPDHAHIPCMLNAHKSMHVNSPHTVPLCLSSKHLLTVCLEHILAAQAAYVALSVEQTSVHPDIRASSNMQF